MMGLGITLLLSCSVFPLVSILAHERLAVAGGECGDGYSAAVLDVGGTSPYVQIVADGRLARTWAPLVRDSDFRRDQSFANNDIAEVLQSLRPGSLLIHGYDLGRGVPPGKEDSEHVESAMRRLRWVVVPPEVQGVTEGLYFFCGVDKHIMQGPGSSQVGWRVTFVTQARRLPDPRI